MPLSLTLLPSLLPAHNLPLYSLPRQFPTSVLVDWRVAQVLQYCTVQEHLCACKACKYGWVWWVKCRVAAKRDWRDCPLAVWPEGLWSVLKYSNNFPEIFENTRTTMKCLSDTRVVQFHSGWPSLTTSLAEFYVCVVIVSSGSFVTTNNQPIFVSFPDFKLHSFNCINNTCGTLNISRHTNITWIFK